MPEDSIPGPTPTGYQRTQGGGFKWQPPTAEHLSKLLPQYEIESILGYGGMGAVYKGTQKSLQRAVAIKILPPGLEDEDASYVERFKNEARVMAKFTHPAIVAVYDFGETSEGQLYIVMEFVDGTDVQKMLQMQGRLPPEHALAVTAHVCDALAYAHKNGVIHRDIKPANVLINMEGAVKVADFGLAKAEEAGASGLTKSGMAMGTPDYVAPETLTMGVNIDGRADLYAVGVMLYAMLTGNVPRGAFKPASVMLPGTDPRFDHIVQKAMQMDRAERYQTAAEIRRDLDAILTAPLVQAGGQSSAAIPKAAVPGNRPAPGGPQARAPRKDAAAAKADPKSEIPNPKSKSLAWVVPTFISAVVIIGGAFMMRGKVVVTPAGEEEAAKPTSSSVPIKVREEPKSAAAAVPTAKSTVSTSPPASNSKSASSVSPSFPSGKWVKLDQTALLSKSGIGSDGWRNPTGPVTDLPELNWKNQGIRLTTRFTGTTSGDAHFLELRRQKSSSGGLSSYQFMLSVSQKSFSVRLDTEESKNAQVIQPLSSHTMAPDTEVTLEFAVVGNQIITRIDDRLQPLLTDATLQSGHLGFRNVFPVRDIEVINLDGLSEAEALKLLDVDGNGNDLRKPVIATATPATAPAPAAATAVAKLLPDPQPLNYTFPLPMPKRPAQAGQVVVWRLDGMPMGEEDKAIIPPADLEDVVQIAAYTPHAVALRANGTVVPLGDRSLAALNIPSNLKDVVKVFAAGTRTAALMADGSFRVWGGNSLDKGKLVKLDGRRVVDAVMADGIDLVLFDSGELLSLRTPATIDETISRVKGCVHIMGAFAGTTGCITHEGKLAWLAGGRASEELGRVLHPILRRPAKQVAVLGNMEGFTVAIGDEGVVGVFPEASAEQLREFVTMRAVVASFDVHAFLMNGRWRFADRRSSHTTDVEYCEREARDCFAVALSRKYAFGIKPLDPVVLAARERAAAIGAPAPVMAAPAAPLSEIDKQLATLETQFQGAAEREAGAAFVQSMNTLNQGYLRALAGALKTVQASGHLDQALVVQEEAKSITANQPVPAEDEATAPDALKKLRATYRTAHAKLIDERTKKLAPLYDRYDATLATLQTDLTKSGKLEDATKVKAKREEIAQRKGGVDIAPVANGMPRVEAASSDDRAEKVKIDPDVSRQVAEYLMAKGANVLVSVKGLDTRVLAGEELPKGKFELLEVYYPSGKNIVITDEDVQYLTRARELRAFSSGDAAKTGITSLEPFRNTPFLERLNIAAFGVISKADCAVLASLKKLNNLSFPGSGKPIEDFALMLSSREFRQLNLSSRMRPEHAEFVNKQSSLFSLDCGTSGVDDEFLSKIGDLEQLQKLMMSQTIVSGAGISSLNAKLAKTLVELTFGKSSADSSSAVSAVIERFPLLEAFHFRGEATADSISKISKLNRLGKLTLHQASITPAHITAISGCKALTELTFGNGSLTATDIAELKRLRTLAYLKIYDNGIKIDSATVLPALTQLKSLTQLDLPESQFTGDQAEALRKQMPGCKIALIKRYD